MLYKLIVISYKSCWEMKVQGWFGWVNTYFWSGFVVEFYFLNMHIIVLSSNMLKLKAI